MTATFVQTFSQLLGLIRFSHTVFALPFAMLSAILAWSLPDSPFVWRHFAGIVICMVGARSAAMAFNRIVDRQIDAENPRTTGRHLPAGTLSVGTVVVFTVVSCVVFFLGTLLFLPNYWPLILAAPVLAFLLGYSYAKRFTVWCHYWLSAALMLAPIAAWLAIRGSIDWPPVILAAVVFFWVGGFDLLYACQDATFDRDTGLFSIPSRWGIPAALRLAFASHLVTAGCLFAFWWVGPLGPIFLTGIVLVTLLLVYEHALVRAEDLSRINVAFFNINAVISIGLLVVTMVDRAWMIWSAAGG